MTNYLISTTQKPAKPKRDYKSLITHLLAGLVIAASYAFPAYGRILKTTGFFALSGALTNWLAIYMLFEKIPFLYGSGIIALQFEDFKKSIKNLVLEQFFSQNQMQDLLMQAGDNHQEKFANFLAERLDGEKIFQGFIEAISSSSFGGMLNMLGGAALLKPLKEPLISKVQHWIHDFVTEQWSQGIQNPALLAYLQTKIAELLDKRFLELTPVQVKDLIYSMMSKHLGWLVVWGGVFGGLMGMLIELL